jgi:hypothetical protein
VNKFRRFIFLALIFCIPLQGFAASGGKLCSMGHAAISMGAQVAGSGHSMMKHQAMKHHVLDQASPEKAAEQAAEQASKSIKVAKCALCAVCCGIALLPEVPIVLPLVSPPSFVPVGNLLATAEFLTSGLERPPRSFLA